MVDFGAKPAFQFDTNKCVGCQACVVACILENGTDIERHWRNVYSFNENHNPGLPIYHFSIACNHCSEAPCMHNCPALAYSRDLITGAVVHHDDKCIGCKYCTWACPYDAPKYNPIKGVVEKCTFCNHKLADGQKPACVTHCPTGALDITTRESITSYPLGFGFDHHYISPAFKLIAPRGNAPTADELKLDIPIVNIPKQSPRKVSFAHEWPLWIFTNIISVLFASAYGLWHNQTILPLWLSLILLISATVFSTLHLGKKLRAWRAILNVRNSWLSREILSFGLFASSYVGHMLFPAYIPSIIPLLLGALLIISADMLYSLLEYPTKLKLHSGQVSITALAYAFLFTGQYKPFAITMGIKFVLFVYNKHASNQLKMLHRSPATWVRVFFGFILPIILISNQISLVIISFLYIIGESADRYMYYNELSVHTPESSIAKAEAQEMSRL